MTVSGCMQTRRAQAGSVASCTMSLALTLMPASLLTVALLAAWSGMEGVVWPALVHGEQLQLASSGNQFSKIGHI